MENDKSSVGRLIAESGCQSVIAILGSKRLYTSYKSITVNKLKPSLYMGTPEYWVNIFLLMFRSTTTKINE